LGPTRGFGLGAQPLELLGIQAHAEREAHRARIVVIPLSEFLPKFFVLSSSASVLGTRSAMVRMFALLRQFDARTESSSSATLRKRFSFRSGCGRVSSRLAAASSAVAWGKVVSNSKWSSRIRDASATAVAGATLPSVHTSRM